MESLPSCPAVRRAFMPFFGTSKTWMAGQARLTAGTPALIDRDQGCPDPPTLRQQDIVGPYRRARRHAFDKNVQVVETLVQRIGQGMRIGAATDQEHVE